MQIVFLGDANIVFFCIDANKNAVFFRVCNKIAAFVQHFRCCRLTFLARSLHEAMQSHRLNDRNNNK